MSDTTVSPTFSEPLPDLSAKAADLLDAAVRIIEAHGWHQFDLWVDAETGRPWRGGPVCAVGALMVAYGQTIPGPTPMPVVRAVQVAEAYLAQRYLLRPGLAVFNDVEASSGHQVVHVMRETAKELRAGALSVPEIEWEKL